MCSRIQAYCRMTSLEVPRRTRRPSEALFADVLPERFRERPVELDQHLDENETLEPEEKNSYCMGRIGLCLCCFWMIPFLCLCGYGDFVKECLLIDKNTNTAENNKNSEQ